MAGRSDLPTHSDIEETVEKHKESMSEKIEDLEILAEDTETVRDARDSLNLEISAEGAEEIEGLVDSAETETIEIFEGEDAQLEDIQSEAEEYEGELTERHDSAEGDRETIADAAGQIATGETAGKLQQATDSLTEEMSFLKENNDRAKEAREETEQAQQELENRINAGRK